MTTTEHAIDSAASVPDTKPRPPKVKGSSRSLKEHLTFLAFAGPNILLIIAFVYRPLFTNLSYSFLDWDLGSPTATSVGLANYKEWFSDPQSLQVMRTTLIFTVTTVGGTLAFGILLALAMNRKVRGTTFARASIFAPYVLSGVGVGIVWLFIFDPLHGALSGLLNIFGISSPAWYTSTTWALVMVIIVYIWKNLGYAAVIYLAALQSIPKDVLEAAAIDGAGPARRFFKVILPLLSPTTFFLLVTTILSSLQSFDIIKIMTKGDPLYSTTTLMYEVYRQGFEATRAGYSAAIAMILFVLLIALTTVQMRFIERRVHYK